MDWVMELAMRILEAEERELVRMAERARESIPMVFPHLVDKTFWVDDYWMVKGEKLTVLEVNGAGKIDEAVFKSPSEKFKVTFVKDGVERVLTYGRIKPQTQVTGSFFALIDEGEYVVGLKDHSFILGAKILVEAEEDLKFTRIYAKWNVVEWMTWRGEK